MTIPAKPLSTSGATSQASQPGQQPTASENAGPTQLTPSTPATVSAPATAGNTALSSLPPVQTTVDGYTADSPQQIGTTTYAGAIRFSCSSSDNSAFGFNTVVYNVAGFKMFTATIGIPNNATNAAGNSATIKFFKDGGSTQLSETRTVALDSPQVVTLNLEGTSQLEIYCQAANFTATNGDDIDVVIGGAALSQA